MSDKLTALPSLTLPPTGEDLVYIVNDPSGTPESRKVTLANLFDVPVFLENLGTNWNKYALGFGVFRIIRILTDAQIKLLPGTGVAIVPAIAAKVVVPRTAIVKKSFTAAGYLTVNAAARLDVGWSPNNSGTLNGIAIYESNYAFFATNNEELYPAPWGSSLDGNGLFFPGVGSPLTDYVNTAINVKASNGGSGNFTGGNAANTLTVTVDYTVIDQ